MEAILVLLCSAVAGGGIAFLGCQLFAATVKLNMLRDQRRRAARSAGR